MCVLYRQWTVLKDTFRVVFTGNKSIWSSWSSTTFGVSFNQVWWEVNRTVSSHHFLRKLISWGYTWIQTPNRQKESQNLQYTMRQQHSAWPGSSMFSSSFSLSQHTLNLTKYKCCRSTEERVLYKCRTNLWLLFERIDNLYISRTENLQILFLISVHTMTNLIIKRKRKIMMSLMFYQKSQT